MNAESNKHIVLQYTEDAAGVRPVQVAMRKASLTFNDESSCFKAEGYLEINMSNPVTYIIPSSRIITIQMEDEIEVVSGEVENQEK